MAESYAERISLTSQKSLENRESDGDDDGKSEMGYQQTLMYGRYSRSLGEFAKEEAKKKQRETEIQRRKDSKRRMRELSGKKQRGRLYRVTIRTLTYIWQHTFAKIGEDWVFLALLGIIMAIVSYVMDEGISHCNRARRLLYKEIDVDNIFLKYIAWVSLPVFLVLFAAGFVHIMAPQAIGSGIPEMKTILRGVVLKEYLTTKTLIAKAVGLTATLGSGMPLGKEGPFVHIASIVATLLASMVTKFKGAYTNEARQCEMLAAACAVGVACCFGSPIGGVLFSIEVTSVFFAVRNYWRGFFAAVCGATMFRLLAVMFHEEATVIAVFRTEFNVEFPYDSKEIIIFAAIGASCGMGGALYVYAHRRYVLWMRGNKSLTAFLQKNRFIYPFLVSLIISTLSFPDWLGKYQASQLGTHDQIITLFSNHTWTDVTSDINRTIVTAEEQWVRDHWNTSHTDPFANMVTFMLMTFFTSIVAATLPVPTGVLIPAFKIGAAFGRLIGEAFYIFFPSGFDNGAHLIVAGGYATIGAAAFAGAVTHTLSISVIIFEMTGQITHIIPMLIAVLIANAIASLLQPSCYDSIIMIKKLPYLPDILPSSSSAYNFFVEDFMMRDVKYIWYGMKYRELREVLKDGKKLRSFPLVDRPDKMILLGSIQRPELISVIERLIGKERRMEVARKRHELEMHRMQVAREEELREEAKRRKEYEAEFKKQYQAELEKEGQSDTPNLPVESENEGASGRRPSRFEVTSVTAPAIEVTKSASAEESAPDPSSLSEKRPSLFDSLGIDLSAKPKKSILKKNNFSTIHAIDTQRRPGIAAMFSQIPDVGREDSSTPYIARNTITGADTKLKSALENFQSIFKRPSNLTLNTR